MPLFGTLCHGGPHTHYVYNTASPTPQSKFKFTANYRSKGAGCCNSTWLVSHFHSPAGNQKVTIKRSQDAISVCVMFKPSDAKIVSFFFWWPTDSESTGESQLQKATQQKRLFRCSTRVSATSSTNALPLLLWKLHQMPRKHGFNLFIFYTCYPVKGYGGGLETTPGEKHLNEKFI